MQGHSNYVFTVSFNPDGSVLASGSSDYTIKLWSMPDGQLIKTLTVSHGDTRVVTLTRTRTLTLTLTPQP